MPRYNREDDYGAPGYDEPYGTLPDPQPTQPTSGPGLTYQYLGPDPSGANVYQGSDGQLYTDDGNGMNGFGPYSGPGVAEQTGPVEPPTPPPTTGPTGPAPGSLDFTAPTPVDMPTLPEFHAPTFNAPAAFVDPSMEEVANDPGYEFARSEGQKAVERSKAAQGVYNTGGTLKDLLGWGNAFASQRYGDVRNRQKDTWQSNYNNSYDAYKLAYQAAQDEFAPHMTGYQTDYAHNEHENDINWQHAYDVWRAQRGDAFSYFGM